jgi:hypothetical protein
MIGPRSIAQLTSNLGALALELSAEQLNRLDTVSSLAPSTSGKEASALGHARAGHQPSPERHTPGSAVIRAQEITVSTGDIILAYPVRTAIGAYDAALKSVPATKLGAIVVRETLRRAGVGGDEIGTVVMGNVIQAGNRTNRARQASIGAGFLALLGIAWGRRPVSYWDIAGRENPRKGGRRLPECGEMARPSGRCKVYR